MGRMEVENDYFEWMFDLVCKGRCSNDHSYRMLLSYLHEVEFTYRIKGDADRAGDGVGLRHRFALDSFDYDYVRNCLDGPCSVLEMMVALAIRCEETIMSDSRYGDRTGQWFWKMVVNLGLGSMTDSRFDERYVEEVIENFLDRKYEPDGRGGLFAIRDSDRDARKMSTWSQLCCFLDTML